MIRIAVMGLGEAGARYARGLAEAGAEVTGFDPFVDVAGSGIRQCARLDECVEGADVVLSLVGARASVDAARDAAPRMDAGALLADLNTASPETKRHVASVAAASGVAVADVAVLAPVPRAGHRTPLLASGEAAAVFAERMRPFGVPVDVVAGGIGDAARLKLLRAMFMKGVAALVLEGLEAARATGAEAWLRGQIASELGPDGEAVVQRLVTGTYTHAERREREMRDAIGLLDQWGTPADMTRATHAWLRRIVDGRG
ncbi:NAD(P)-binding domain-containing protein [Microbacterium sp. NPDC096154]|uniref:NAD(P)-dependent oxidoreductase n=1 Tax=Microbacterium sp. NPDC096154 TaxID=3155549 RepID=UPI00331B55B9